MKRIPIYKLMMVRDGSVMFDSILGEEACSSTSTAKLLSKYLEGSDREHFVVLMLSAKLKIIGISTVSIGSLTAAVVSPREVFKPAILANAAHIVIAHNHPSGNVTPSQDDKLITRQLVQAGTVLDIKILDHLIIAEPDNNGDIPFYSFAAHGEI